jgi:hypothetical protein
MGRGRKHCEVLIWLQPGQQITAFLLLGGAPVPHCPFNSYKGIPSDFE